METIKVFNSYFINDISNIIYDYYFDDSKIIQAKKDFLIEYHKKVKYILSDNLTYYPEPDYDILYINDNKYYPIPLLINSRGRYCQPYETSDGLIASITSICRFDKLDEKYNRIYSGELPNNYIIWHDRVIDNIANYFNNQWVTEWCNKQRLLKDRYEVK